MQENLYENVVCEMAAIFSRGRWVNVTQSSLQCICMQHYHMGPRFYVCTRFKTNSKYIVVLDQLCILQNGNLSPSKV